MMTLIETRNRHFMKACREIIHSLPRETGIDLAEVARMAAMSPAPHYYCTYEYALRMLRVLRHGRLELRRDRRRLMWEELNIKTRLYETRHRCRMPEALAKVLAGESASQFFISPSTALRLVQSLRAESLSNLMLKHA